MYKKKIKITFLFLLLTTLTGCPSGEEDGTDYGKVTRVDDLITITPLQSTYNQGDIVTFKASIPGTILLTKKYCSGEAGQNPSREILMSAPVKITVEI